MQFWKKLSQAECSDYIDQALNNNIDFSKRVSLGIPASKLDGRVFYDQAAFLKDAPFLRAIVQNPNHIGCHTLSDSEMFFKGTQQIERELIELIAVDIFKAAPGETDGYVAAGGTEANLQAVWIYRNYFIQNHHAAYNEIVILASEDTHYSVVKAGNLMHLDYLSVPVHENTRMIDEEQLDRTIAAAKQAGKKYFIVLSNVATTMFGSVDDPDVYARYLSKHEVLFKLHLDGAFGGFIYPIAQPDNNTNFSNPHVNSITLDAHKMLQAPYGTGIFLVRKGWMQYVFTREASYVNGMDITLSGSRSGANAIAIWMILAAYGPYGWYEKIHTLLYRTTWACKQLSDMGVEYYRNPFLNIITIKSKYVPQQLADAYGLVPDAHEGAAQWFKIVVMDHVEVEQLQPFLEELKQLRTKTPMDIQVHHIS
ncbi:MAG TPA: pyridoxal-dependent decarboxylase [Flavipsychrobacter sp.]|nr:pyridoxal-dependent decarboxylase [Flavipsychrobacter sp.]